VKYLYLLYADESKAPAPGTPEMKGLLDAYDRYWKDISEHGVAKGGDPVQASSTAVTVRVRNGSTQTSPGPYRAGGEQIIGFYLMDCKDQKEAVAYAAKVPAAQAGAIEVRPILQQ
jgi:hypothetical protein